MIKGMIFDLDDVLISTVKYHYMAWKKLSNELNLKFDIEDNELLKGVSRIRSFSIILDLNNVEMTKEEIERYTEKKNSYYQEYISGVTEKELLPGVKRFIQETRERGYKTAVVSSSRNAKQLLVQTGIYDLFDVIVDGNMVESTKPNSELFLKGADALVLKYNECLVFDNTINGIVASHDAGIKAVGVKNTEIKEISDYFIDGFNKVSLDVVLKKI